MYESFYGLKEKPFSLLPDPAFLYLSRQHEMAITLLEYSLENQAGFCVITGKAGTGKTTLLRRLLNQIGDDVVIGLITNTHHSFGELLRWILHAFRLDDSADTRACRHQVFVDYLIAQYAANRRTMLIIDEAQNMSAEALEELRMLSNINSEKDLLLQMILVGQPPLRDILRRPELEQFAQRVAVDYHLDALSAEETRGYIRHRLKVAGGEPELFRDDACEAVFIHSRGVPRLINLLCDLALVYAYAGQAAAVTGELVEQVVRDREQHGALPVFAAAVESPVRPVAQVAWRDISRPTGKTVRAPRDDQIAVPPPRADAAITCASAAINSPATEENKSTVVSPQPSEPDADMTDVREGLTQNTPAAALGAVPPADPAGAADRPAGMPVPARAEPPRRVAADRRAGVWPYAAVIALVFLVAASVLGWHFRDRPELKLAIADVLSPSRAPADQAPRQRLVEAASANRPAVMTTTPPAAAVAPASVKDAAEEIRLREIQRERDAALAAAETASREREAWQRAAQARERALAAEHEAALARERERAAQLARAAELAVLQAHAVELEAQAKTRAMQPLERSPEVKQEENPVNRVIVGAEASPDVRAETAAVAGNVKAPAAFTANPCKGASARFLSTCE